MKKSNAQKVKALMAKYPNMKAVDIATKAGVRPQYVYQISHNLKKASLPLTAIAPLGVKPKRKYTKRKAVSNLLFEHSQGRAPMRMKTIATFTSDTPIAGKLRTAVDNVNHPSHYKTGGIETIDFIEAKDLGYHLGNVIKYVTRADHKGNKKEDLLKAQWYLNRAIAKL